MLKFIHKKHMHLDNRDSKIIIYYNASDIFLGVVLLVLVAFFINNYLSNILKPSGSCGVSPIQAFGNPAKMNSPVVRP